MKEYKNGNIGLTTAELLTEGPKLLAKGYTQVLVSKTGVRFAPPEHLKPKSEDKGTPKTFADSQAAEFGFTEEQCDTVYKYIVEGNKLGRKSSLSVEVIVKAYPKLTSKAVWAAFRAGRARRIAAQMSAPKVEVPGTIVLPELPANVTDREMAEAKSETIPDKTWDDVRANTMAIELGFNSYKDLKQAAKGQGRHKDASADFRKGAEVLRGKVSKVCDLRRRAA